MGEILRAMRGDAWTSSWRCSVAAGLWRCAVEEEDDQ